MALLLCLACLRIAAEPAPNRLGAAGPDLGNREIVVGADVNNFPYSFLNEQGRPDGFAVELLDSVARTIGLRIRRVVLGNNEVKERFQAGELDMLQLLGEASGREKWASYSVPVLYTENRAFVHRKNRRAKTLAQLEPKRVAVAGIGSASDLFVGRSRSDVETVYADSAEHALRLVDSGQVDTALIARTTGAAIIRRLGLDNVVELDDAVASLGIRRGFAVHPGDTALLARLNEGLAMVHRSGEYDRIYRKWLEDYDPITVSREKLAACVSIFLFIALVVAVWTALRQRRLRRRVASQAAELAAQGELLTALYENMPLGMLVFDMQPEGARLCSLNRQASEWLGLAVVVGVGRRLDELPLVPDWAALLKKVLHNPSCEGGFLTEGHRLPALCRDLLVTCTPLTTPRAAHQRICILIDDVTERHRLDEEVAEGRRLRALGELVGGIAHEFNNLMTPVLLKIGDLRDYRQGDAELQADLAVVDAAMHRSSALTARLLTLGRKADDGSAAPGTQIATVVAEQVAHREAGLDQRIVIENALPDGLPAVSFSSRDLGQVLGGLLSNACDTLVEKMAAGAGPGWVPRIRISAEQLPAERIAPPPAGAAAGRALQGWLRLSVSDNGMGMAPSVKERVFEPFYTTKGPGRGAGLGLSTAWHLMATAGGRIEVEGASGVGSCFHLVFPLWAAVSQSRAAPVTAARHPGDPVSIFLAEDDRLVADSIVAVLRRSGHRVRNIGDGASALEHLRLHYVDYALLIIDINLPGIDGVELARQVRLAGYAGRIMAISGRIENQDVSALQEVGVDGILSKPFSPPELIAVVEACLNRREPAPGAVKK